MKFDIKECLVWLRDQIVPFWKNYKDKKTLKEKIEKLSEIDEKYIDLRKFNTAGDFSQVPLCIVQESYNKSLDRKKILEDKAKVNVLGVTIFISIIAAVSENVVSLYSAFENVYIRFFFYGIGIISVAYIMVSGLLAIELLMDINTVCLVEEQQQILPCDIQKKIYSKNMGLNDYYNLIRNNYIYTSYQCLRNGLVVFVFIYAIALWPGLYVDKEKETIKEYIIKIEVLQSKVNELECSQKQIENKIIKNENTLNEVLTRILKNEE